MATQSPSQNPEQRARDRIDRQLRQAGWLVQNKNQISLNAGPGVAVREYLTEAGQADYVLFVQGRAVGVIEAKPEVWGHKISTVEEQAEGYVKFSVVRANEKEIEDTLVRTETLHQPILNEAFSGQLTCQGFKEEAIGTASSVALVG